MFVGVDWLEDKSGGVLENWGGKNRFGGLPGRLKLSFCSELNPRPVFSVYDIWLGWIPGDFIKKRYQYR